MKSQRWLACLAVFVLLDVLVEKHFGAQVARKLATGLVIDWEARRAGYRAAAVDSGS